MSITLSIFFLYTYIYSFGYLMFSRTARLRSYVDKLYLELRIDVAICASFLQRFYIHTHKKISTKEIIN